MHSTVRVVSKPNSPFLRLFVLRSMRYLRCNAKCKAANQEARKQVARNASKCTVIVKWTKRDNCLRQPYFSGSREGSRFSIIIPCSEAAYSTSNSQLASDVKFASTSCFREFQDTEAPAINSTIPLVDFLSIRSFVPVRVNEEN